MNIITDIRTSKSSLFPLTCELLGTLNQHQDRGRWCPVERQRDNEENCTILTFGQFYLRMLITFKIRG